MHPMAFCSACQTIPLGMAVAKLPNRAFTWTILSGSRFYKLSADQARRAFERGWAKWAAVCDIAPSWTADANAADIVIGTGAIDGPSKVLAWTELPPEGGRPAVGGVTGRVVLHMRVDDAEMWSAPEPGQPIPAGTIDLGRTVCHEMGHALGLGHLQGPALMQPTYSEQIDAPLAPDIAEVVSRYGKPKDNNPPSGPPDLPPPAPPQAGEYVITLPTPTTKIIVRAA